VAEVVEADAAQAGCAEERGEGAGEVGRFACWASAGRFCRGSTAI
jgi:hypothetical protein